MHASLPSSPIRLLAAALWMAALTVPAAVSAEPATLAASAQATAPSAPAQGATGPAPTPAPDAGSTAAPAATPRGPESTDQASAETPAEGGGESALERFLPELDLLFPEGALDLKASRLVNNVLFEGQVRYAFVNGDITAFLRYRYYGATRTTQVEVFDQINFANAQSFSTQFERTRGLLVFEEWPHSYAFRTFAMGEIDRISSNQEAFLTTNNATNTFLRLGLQLGGADDSRSRAIVGDSRSYIPNIFTAVREIGPNQFGFTGALSYGLPTGDFNYLKVETQTLKRFDLTDRTFLIGTLHQGSFLFSQVRDAAASVSLDPEDRFSIPISEFFTIGGPDNLKGLSSNLIGSQELHTTWELYMPWFLDQHHQVFNADWQSWYWILYAGAGTLGYTSKTYVDISTYIPDTGLGFESAVHIWRYRFFVSAILARALKGTDHLEARLSVRSYR
jgi:hypothetical protein